ncbi:MAG: hypothetical protein J2P50_07075 [Hyphomicrobiaceae bacterium]|nr:hypothetical protein [Hyphomicrobiaceae bacterium]
MATVRSLDGTEELGHRGLRKGSPGRVFLGRLATYWSAFREARAAAHKYERLVRQGMPHEKAVARIFEDHFED